MSMIAYSEEENKEVQRALKLDPIPGKPSISPTWWRLAVRP